jgi:hypothetical protein
VIEEIELIEVKILEQRKWRVTGAEYIDGNCICDSPVNRG